MANELLKTATKEDSSHRAIYSITTGTVVNNVDMIMEGRIQVHLTSFYDVDPWARISATMAGKSRGFVFIPQIGDEVLVAFNQDDVNDAYILGGLWNGIDRPPGMVVPTDFLTKRVIKTGVVPGVGHEIEFDDAKQSITITTSTKQNIVMDPLKIEVSNLAGSIKITLDNTAQSITIQASASIEIKAPNIKIQGANIDIEGAVATNVKSSGVCNINAPLVKIN